MLFDIALYLSLAVCAAGVAWRVWRWLGLRIGPEARGWSRGQRARHLLRGGLAALFSRRLPAMLWAFAVDGLLQRRAWRASRLGWAAHMLIYSGFTLLVLFHALDGAISRELFDGFEASLNPWLFLRDLFGVMVLAGAGLAVWRRVREPGRRRVAQPLDHLIIGLVAAIILSGFAAKGLMIASHVEFEDMVYGYSLYQEPEEVADLAAWWAAEYGVEFPEEPAADAQSLARGRELSADSCVDCHSRPQWAFASWAASRAAAPASPWLAERDASGLLVQAHFLLAFLALALAPFTKFFHVLTSPVLLMARRAARPGRTHPANLATLRAMELDACMHCTTCSVHCSVALAAAEVPGRSLLPSEKLARLSRLAAGGDLGPGREGELLAGNEVCTRCYRCTRLCPAGINLQDLWEALSADLMARGLAEPHAAARSRLHDQAEGQRELAELRFRQLDKHWLEDLTSRAQSFAGCYNCRTCTAACPVVKAYDEPVARLDLLPHQIMHALGLGMREEAMGARMAWDCLTCYRCQEACPQGVKVTEVLAELRNLAAGRLRGQRKESA